MAWDTGERYRRIVIADDDPVQRWLLRNSLTKAGYDVLEATNGRDAWHIIQHEGVQVVITNWMMPEMDGPALVRQIRDANLDNYVYVIMLTARDTKLDIVDGLQSGADDYLTKPFDFHELQARVAISKRILKLEANLREARDHERMLARHDSLTGLLNRRAIYEHAETELARAVGDSLPLSLILLDIDFFKEVNDQYGHLIGDQMLYLVAATIAHNRRPTDWAGRWGGEEFLLVLPNTTIAEAASVAERLRSSIASARLPLSDGRWLYRTTSLGVAGSPANVFLPLDILLQQADKALYRAKEEGRNRCCQYTDELALLNGKHLD